MGLAFRKIWRDLWQHQWRTLLVVLSLSVGVMAVGMIVTAQTLMQRQMAEANRLTHPPHVVLNVSGQADQEALAALASLPGVAQADGVSSLPVRWKVLLTDPWERAAIRQEAHGILLNQKIARDLKVLVGEEVEIDYGALGKQRWRVIGLLADISGGQLTGYVPREQLGLDVGGVGRASVAMTRLKTKTMAAQERFSDEVRALFKSQGMTVTDVFTLLKFQREASGMFTPIAGVLMTMSILIALVGSLSLSSTLSLNVIERRREIGVMRAVGASSGDVAFVFMCEGLLLGWLSWVCALPLSWLGAPAFLQALSEAFVFPMSYQYQPGGAAAWLMIVTVLSLVASGLPARQATQLSVQQSLAYE